MRASKAIRRVVMLGLVVAGAAVAGCTAKDNTPPPAPWVDPVSSPTSLPTQWLTGSAEYGTTVTVSGGAEDATTVADPFTAKFRVEVALVPGADNSLSVTATDARDNVSEPTVVTIVHETAHPEALRLELEPRVISADDGRLVARARIANDEPEIDLSGFAIQFALGGDFSGSLEAQTDGQGMAEVAFEGLTAVGAGSVTATAADFAGAQATQPFEVVGGRPALVDLALSDGISSSADLTTVAGSLVVAEVTVSDAAGNPLDVPVSLSTDAPALIDGLVLLDLVQAGDYTVVATVFGGWVTATAQLHVVPDAPALAGLELSADTTVAGVSIVAAATAFDQYGNPIGAEAFGYDLQPVPAAPAGPVVGDVITVEAAAGDYQVIATLDSDPAITAQAPLRVDPGPLSLVDLQLASAQVSAGDTVAFDVSLADAYGNPRLDAVQITTTAPGAVISPGLIGNLVVAGDFIVYASVAGSQVGDSEPLQVLPGAPARIDLTLSASVIPVGEQVVALYRVWDAHGNFIDGTPVDLVASPAQGWTLVGDAFTFSDPGTYAIDATVSGSNPAVSDRAYVWVQREPDLDPPVVAIQDVRRNGVACPLQGECEVVPGDTVSFDLVATDAGGLAELSYSAFFATDGVDGTLRTRTLLVPDGVNDLTQLFAFRVPGGTSIEDVPLVGQAMDASGNRANTGSYLLQVRPIAPRAADGQAHAIDVVGVLGAGGGSAVDAAFGELGQLLLADDNNDAVVQFVDPVNWFVVANLPDPPEYLAADGNGFGYVSLRGGTDSVMQVDLESGAVSTYMDLANDVDTGACGNSGGCDPGNGNGHQPGGLALLRVTRGQVRFSPGRPTTGNQLEVADGAGAVRTYGLQAGGDVEQARDLLVSAIGADPFPGLAAIRGACALGGNLPDYADTELVADDLTLPADVDIQNLDGDPDVLLDAPLDAADMLFVGTRDRWAFQLETPASPVAGMSCFHAQHDFGGGREARGIAAAFEGQPGTLVVYGADPGGDRIRRLDVASGNVTTVATVFDPRDIVVAPSGCLIVSENNRDRVVTIDARGPAPSYAVSPLVDGFSNVRGLNLDAAEVVADRLVADALLVRLRARVPGSGGNALALTTTAANLSLTPFSGGADGPNPMAATGSVLVTGDATDGELLVVGNHTYELDFDLVPNVQPGNVPLRPASINPPDVAAALEMAIRQTEARLLIVDRNADAVVQVGPSLAETADCF